MEASASIPSASTTPPPAETVEYDKALAEEANVDQVRSRPRPGSESDVSQEDQLDLLAPKKGAQVWGFGKGEDGKPIKSYVQRELSVITKAQWFRYVGDFLEKTLGEVSLNALFSPPDSVRQAMQGGGTNAEGVPMRPQDFEDADTFVQAIGKLLVQFPDFLQDSICIWLAVPDYEWDLVKELMKMSPELGGLSDAQMFDMIEVFIDQNYEAIRQNFPERLSRLRDRWQARSKEQDQSRSRKR